MKKAAVSQKCRGQRISTQELITEAQQRLEECGVSNHQRAFFVRLTAEVLVGNRNPLFAQQQPKKPKSVQNVYWVQAYAIALQFLKELDLKLTLETILIERPDVPAGDRSLTGNTLTRLVQLGQSSSNASFGERADKAGKSGSSAGKRQSSQSSQSSSSKPKPPARGKGKAKAKPAPTKGKSGDDWSDPDD
jgi:hypothetical protein